MKLIVRTLLFVGLVGGGSVGVWYYQQRNAQSYQIAQLETQKQQLEHEKQELRTVVTRLAVEKRVAKVLVTDQQTDSAGKLHTTLLFVEYARDGSSLPGKRFTIDGNMAHVDAMVIKFDRDCVAQFDPLRGHSIALFTRLFAENQAPEKAFPIDAPGQIPDVYRGEPKQAAEQAAFEKDLWQNFWHLASDKAYRESKLVRVANGQGIWSTFEPGKLYVFTIEADGGLNMLPESIEGIYREALQPKSAQTKRID